MKGMICIFLSKIKCVEGEGSWMWKHSPSNKTWGQKVIRNRENSRAKQRHQHRSLTAKELLSVLRKSLRFSPARMHFSAFPTWMNCAAHQLDLGLGQDTTKQHCSHPCSFTLLLDCLVALSQQELTLPSRSLRKVGRGGNQYWSLLPGFSLKPVTALSVAQRQEPQHGQGS